MKDCPFCEELRKWKEIRASRARTWQDSENYEEIYGASLVSREYYEGQHVGTQTGVFHELNFCPVCGTKILKEDSRVSD